MSAKRLAIVLTHPIQYYSPIFQLLSRNNKIIIKIFYTWSQSSNAVKYDPGFQRNISWDIPLLEGYNYEFVPNISRKPGSHHFNGMQNPTLNSTIEKWKPDAILIFGWSFSSHLSCLKYFKGKVPIFFRGDSTLIDEKEGFSIKKVIRQLFLTWVYRYIDYAFYVGAANKRYYLRNGVKEECLFYAPHAVDNSRFSNISLAESRELDQWKDTLKIRGCFVLLFSGKLEQKKNPEILIALSKKLLDADIRFVIIGNGPLESKIKEQALGDARFVFLDFQNQRRMPLVYRLANVYILPSVGPGETWGLAINEAMASGLPVIATTKVGGAQDLIENYKNGIVVEPNTLDEIVAFIENIKVNAEYRITLGNYSSNKVKNFDINEVAKKIEDIVMQI